jgi:hypothetical protein
VDGPDRESSAAALGRCSRRLSMMADPPRVSTTFQTESAAWPDHFIRFWHDAAGSHLWRQVR